MKRRLAVLAFLPLLASCGAGFEDDDPKGYEACSQAAEVDRTAGSASVDEALSRNEEIANLALEADTPEIRDTAGPLVEGDDSVLGDFNTVDLDELLDACEEAGFEPASD